MTTTTDYIGGFVYTDNALTFFSSPEGRVVKSNGNYEYQYTIQDHQGNTRILFTSATPASQLFKATFEDTTKTAEMAVFHNYPTGAKRNAMNLYDHTDAGSTYTYSNLLNGGYDGQVGIAKTFKVYPGDKISIKAFGKYHSQLGTSNLTGFATALLSAFSLSAPGGSEIGTPAAGVNKWGGIVAGGGGEDNTGYPKAFVNLLIFDKNYNKLDLSYDGINGGEQTGGTPAPHDSLYTEYIIKEEGYVFGYVSNENPTLVDVYFDDVTMTYTPSRVIQTNEYYAHGMPTANSWTRENALGNNFLGNGGTELNATSNLYDLDYRSYDPALARLNQVDPLADNFSSLSPYHFAYNNPTGFTDQSGAMPWSADFAASYFGSDYGTRNARAKMLAHGYSGEYVGGAGEAWGAAIDIYGDGFVSWGSQYGSAPADLTQSVTYENEKADRESTQQYWLVDREEGSYLYFDKSFQDLKGWFRAEYHETGGSQTQGDPGKSLLATLTTVGTLVGEGISATAVSGLALVALAGTVLQGDASASKHKDDLNRKTYYHYTNATGLAGIMKTARITPDPKGNVYITDATFSAADAFQNLFLSQTTHLGRGDYVVAFYLDKGQESQLKYDPVQPFEYVWQNGTLKIDHVLWGGPNPLK